MKLKRCGVWLLGAALSGAAGCDSQGKATSPQGGDDAAFAGGGADGDFMAAQDAGAESGKDVQPGPSSLAPGLDAGTTPMVTTSPVPATPPMSPPALPPAPMSPVPNPPAPNPPGPMTCQPTSVPYQRTTKKELVVVLDRSGSMLSIVADSGRDRWTEMTQALDAIIRKTGSAITWAGKMTPSDEGCGVTPNLEVPLGPNSNAYLLAHLMATKPNTGAPGSPMGLAIRQAMKALPVPAVAGLRASRFLLIASDGMSGCAKDVDDTALALQDAAAAGVHAFVMGSSTLAGTSEFVRLNQYAVAGKEDQPGPTKFFQSGTATGIKKALDQITNTLSTCVFVSAQAPVLPASAVLMVNGAGLPRDPSRVNGWAFGGDNQTIQIYGPACQALKSGAEPQVQLLAGCASGTF